MKQIIRNTAAALALLMAMGGAAHAAGPFMKTTGATSRPIGHDMFCRQYPTECRVRTSRPVKMQLSRMRWRELVSVNTDVNLAIEPVTDQEHYGVEEHWTFPRGYGDCEDYALLKRHMLIAKGWSPSSLLITVVLQPDGSGHAVLTARTSKGDFVLDNLRPKVALWTATPYRYLKRQSTRHARDWVDISDRRAEIARR